MSHNVFAYGTLEVPTVMRIVTGREFSSCDAVLHGYQRFLLEGLSYPGIVQEPGRSTHGRLYLAVDEVSLVRLDTFEDELYERLAVRVVTSSEESHPAWTYVVPESRRGLLSRKPWDREGFVRRHLESFLTRCRRYGP